MLKAGGEPRNTQLLASQRPGLVPRAKASGCSLPTLPTFSFSLITQLRLKKKTNLLLDLGYMMYLRQSNSQTESRRVVVRAGAGGHGHKVPHVR